MKAFRNLLFSTLFASLVFFTNSCMEGQGNYQTFSSLTGSIVSSNGMNFLRLDGDNSTFYYSPDFTSYSSGDRILTSFKIDYDAQTSSSYYTVSDVVAKKFPLKEVAEINTAEADTFQNASISGFNSQFMASQGSSIYLTVNPYYYASTTNHSFNLVKNNLTGNSSSDTLKLEFRHNAKGDTNSTSTSYYLVSFDLTPYLSSLSSGTTKVIQIKYNVSSSNYYKYFSYTAN